MALTLEQALAVATNSGSSTGNPARLGGIAVGQLADLTIIDTSATHHLGAGHPVPALGLHARAADVTIVIVAGRLVVEGGVLVDTDEHELRARAAAVMQSMSSHARP
ncbi:amidohydrolase family protein [Williamsia sp.]|uniref:amidohydrolase family protein n=1 Tax=Williamsia sp. TaxID=1872085 RepID=UPI001A310358|nr:amidohydrolase family protein [Williamsia sp.]MBJ7291542.1 amidohydrolase family protein [Williamsia sp.]